ncbi:hypothetical protein [Paenibacillus sp. OAE614]|uniref:hypothetical protein n=1 Tax=Paenibacillus sp. OAE614 TaxID=2663804 RepID=UPI00178A752D
MPCPVLAVLHSHRKDLTPSTRRWQQRSVRNHAGEAAAVAFVPEFSPFIPFPKNSGATAIGGMIRTRSGLPKHAQYAPAERFAVLHSHRKDLTPPLAAGSSGAGGIMPEKR